MTINISLKNLKKSFGKQDILKGINLTVNSGEIVGLIGPNQQQLKQC